MQIHLSVIVCTYNRSGLLADCLDSLERQTLSRDRFEIVVVDNNSTDDTREVTAKHQAYLSNIRYIFEPTQGLSHARNRGCAEATGTHLVYVDDDARVPPRYLSSVLSALDRAQPDILGGPVYPFYTTAKPRWFRDEYEIRRYADQSEFSTSCTISGSNFVIRKELLRQLGGFDPGFGMRGNEQRLGEDRKLLELYRRGTPIAAQRVYYDLDCVVLHWVPPRKMRVLYVLGRAFRAGRMIAIVTGTGSTPESLAAPVIRYPRTLHRMLRAQLANGVRQIDWIEIARALTVQAGKFLEGSRQSGRLIVRRLRATVGLRS